MSTVVLRLSPHQDLRQSIESFCRSNNIASAAVLTCVGSLEFATLRMAGADQTIERTGPFEILSLVGVITPEGGHVHISLSDKNGTVWGGHLCMNSLIYTTAEIVLLDIGPHHLSRIYDPATGYPELAVGQTVVQHDS